MTITKTILFFLICTSVLCCSNNKKEIPKVINEDIVVINERYNHTYNMSGRLEKSNLLIVEETGGYSQSTQIEIIYKYRGDKLISKESYELTGQEKELSTIELFSENKSSYYSLRGKDTSLYRVKFLDNKGLVLREIVKHKLKVPEYDIDTNIDTDDSYTYDSIGRMTSVISKNNVENKIEKGKYLYTTIKDTLIKSLMIDNQLRNRTKFVKNKEFLYDNTNKLIHYTERIIEKDSTIEISKDETINKIDSTFYYKDKPVKIVSRDTNRYSTSTIEYDKKGNIILERTEMTIRE